MILVTRFVEYVEHIGVGKVDVALLIWTTIDISAINALPCCETSELHDVASERACFIREHVFNLTKLLV